MKPATGKELKEIGQAAALENSGEWCAAMRKLFVAFLKVRKDMGQPYFKTEDLRMLAEKSNWPLPKSAAAWGAFTSSMCKAGLIVWTGLYEPAESKATHGHPVKVWRAA